MLLQSASIRAPVSAEVIVPLAPGKRLLPLVNVRGRAIFCDTAVTWRGPGLLDGRRLRACLLDRENDGVFDRLLWMGVADANNFGGMFVYEDARTLTWVSVPYVRETGGERMMTAAAVVTRSPLGAYRLIVALRDNGEIVPLTAEGGGDRRASDGGRDLEAASTYFRAEDAPLTINLSGARIEISAVSGRQVNYRVLSGFEPSRSMAIGYNRQMPVPAEHDPTYRPR